MCPSAKRASTHVFCLGMLCEVRSGVRTAYLEMFDVIVVSLFAIDVPLEFSCRPRLSAGAVDFDLVSDVVPGVTPCDDRSFVGQV